VLNAGGEQSSRFYPGDKLVFRINFETDQPIEHPVFGLALETIEGLYAWAFHSRDGGFLADRIDGRGSVDLTVPSLPLQAGTYDLNASIVDHTTTHTFDFLRSCYRFDVLMRAPHESGGIVLMGGQWENLTMHGAG
jgi:Wzt C-terminal domain